MSKDARRPILDETVHSRADLIVMFSHKLLGPMFELPTSARASACRYPDTGQVQEMTQTATTPNWTRVGLWLVAGTMAYNLAEAGIALWSGVVAHSIALVGFGLDSIIELAAREIPSAALGAEAKETLACSY